MQLQILPIDGYGFTIVKNLEELNMAKAQGHVNVKVPCPFCGWTRLVAIADAAKKLSSKCTGCKEEELKEQSKS